MDDFSDLQSNQIPPQQYPHYGYKPMRSNAFMGLSLSFGIISITCSSVIFISMIAAGLSILFAILSRGNDKKFTSIAKAGIITSVLGLACSIFVTISAFYMVINNAEYRAQVNDMCQQLYGTSFDDMLKEINPDFAKQLPGD